ncbi:MAG: FAD-dependent oxidoreductase, partial [Candidatus Dadabacteria bacterium]
SLGILWPPSPTRTADYQAIHRESLQSYPAFVAEIEQVSGIPTGYKMCGGAEALMTEHEYNMAQKEIAASASSDFDRDSIEIITPQDFKNLETNIMPAPLGAALWKKVAGVNIQQLIKSLDTALIRLGVSRFYGSGVERLVRDGKTVTLQLKNATYSAAACIVAAGADSGRLLLEHGLPLQIDTVPGEALGFVTESILLRCIYKESKIFFHPVDNKKLIVGATTELKGPQGCLPTEAAQEKLFTVIKRALGAKSSSIKEIYHWRGLRPRGPARKPVIGKVPGSENIFVAAGHYKLGTALAPVTASLLRDQILFNRLDNRASFMEPQNIFTGKAA